MTKKRTHLVAVYGSLLKGLGNHSYYLDEAEYKGEFDSEPIYNLYDIGQFPGLTKPGYTSVRMEVYEVTDKELKQIDILEGFTLNNTHNNHYNRTTIKTPYGDAYTYLYNHHVSDKTQVSSGDWRDYYNTKNIAYV